MVFRGKRGGWRRCRGLRWGVWNVYGGHKAYSYDYGGHPAPTGPALPNLINAVSMFKVKVNVNAALF